MVCPLLGVRADGTAAAAAAAAATAGPVCVKDMIFFSRDGIVMRGLLLLKCFPLFDASGAQCR